METAERDRTITIRLHPAEVQFLITVLKSSATILTAIMALECSMPGLSPPPINTDAIRKIAALAHSIEQQT
jgi:hypothetical protein